MADAARRSISWRCEVGDAAKPDFRYVGDRPVGNFPSEYPSRVERVVLYPGMAEVTRVAEVGKPEGTVVLSGLTPNLRPDTLSAKVEKGDARIAGVSIENLFRTEPVDKRVKELEKRIEDLTRGKRISWSEGSFRSTPSGERRRSRRSRNIRD
jgi:hypothetical protein